MVSSHTYIASWEIIVVGAAVSYVRRLDLFAVTGAKYAIERQRYTDATSFVGTKAFGNSYNPQLDGSQSTPTYVLRTIYRPLVEILLWSLLSICSVLLLRFLVFRLWIRCRSWRRQQVAKVRAAVAKAEDESNDEGADNQLFKKRGDIGGSTHRPAEPTTASNISEEQSEYEKYEDELYTRLPIEELLNIPIRALSLVRGGLAMETIGDRGQRFVRTPLMAEHGVVLDKGRLRVRHGFFCNLQPDIELDGYLPRKVRSVLSSIDLNGRAKNT